MIELGNDGQSDNARDDPMLTAYQQLATLT
jgi:hypothetical protein